MKISKNNVIHISLGLRHYLPHIQATAQLCNSQNSESLLLLFFCYYSLVAGCRRRSSRFVDFRLDFESEAWNRKLSSMASVSQSQVLITRINFD
ncbi:hypothetical protein LINPERHAP2_LOCUS34695 [Linum perenne]